MQLPQIARKGFVVAASSALIAGLIVGCGGGGGGGGGSSSAGGSSAGGSTSGGDGTVPAGNKAFQAAAVSGYQSVGAVTSTEFKAVLTTLPAGNTVLGFYKSLAKPFGSTRDLSYDASEKLYFSYATSGNKAVLTYYKTDNTSQPAGIMTFTSPGQSTISTTYPKFPAIIQIAVNITAGACPVTGSATLTYSGGSGANTMVGQLNLTKNKVSVDMNLGLSGTGAVTGSMNIKQNGMTAAITNLTGPFTGDLNGSVAISPQGWTGTAKVNILDGSYHINAGSGTAGYTAADDGAGNLNLEFADGSTQLVANALSADLTGGATVPTGVQFKSNVFGGHPITLDGMSDDGRIFANIGSGSANHPIYYASFTSAATNVTGPSGWKVAVHGANTKGHLVGGGETEDSNSRLVNAAWFWSNPQGSPATLPLASGYTGAVAYAMNNNDAIAGAVIDKNGASFGAVWSSPTATPVVLSSSIYAYGISDTGTVMGYDSDFNHLLWVPSKTGYTQVTVTAAPAINSVFWRLNSKGTLLSVQNQSAWVLSAPYTTATKVNMTGFTSVDVANIGPDNQIIATGKTPTGDLQCALFWTSATAAATNVSASAGTSENAGVPEFVSHNNTIMSTLFTDTSDYIYYTTR